MVTTVSLGNLDGLVGLTFGANGFANAKPTLINGSLGISSTSTSEVLTFGGVTATVGGEFIGMKTVSYQVVSVSDADNTLVLDAYVGTTLVGELDFHVAGFSPAGIILSAMPLDSLVTQSDALPGLAGSLFVLGNVSAGAKAQSVTFNISSSYTFIANAGVHYATAANPVLQGGKGAQMLIALSGNDTITGGPGKTIIYGGPGNDTLTAGTGINLVFGGAGNDTIIGGSGSDTLTGGSGTDTIIAGTGHMVMVGGTGADRFVFAPGHTGGLTAATADAIQHFHPVQGDVIDLTAFDAGLAAGGTGHLKYMGTAAFDGHAGEVRYDVTSTGVTVSIDMTGAGTADAMFTIKGPGSLVAGDFVL